jgi:hypothetical protein
MGIIAEMLIFCLILGAFVAYISLLIAWEILKVCWRLLLYLYEVISPEIKEFWNALRQQWIEARKPQDIQAAGTTTRREIDQVLAYYRQQADQILQAEQAGPPPFSEVILFFEEDYKIINQ